VKNIGNKSSKDEIDSPSKQRHFLYNIYLIALLRASGKPVFEQDEFGI